MIKVHIINFLFLLFKQNATLSKLSQLEIIKTKHLARLQDGQRHITTTAVPVNNNEQRDFLNSLLSSSPNSNGLLSTDNTSLSSPLFPPTNEQSSPYSSTFQYQRSSSQQFDSRQSPAYIDVKTPLFDELSMPPPPSSSSSSYIPVNNTSTYMNMTSNDPMNSSFFSNHQQHPAYRY